MIAKILSNSWQNKQPQIDISEDELRLINPMLQGSGAGGLGWWHIRESPVRTSQTGEELHQAYRLHTLTAARHEQNIQSVFRLLRENGVEPMLVKGWAIARLYPAKGLRSYGDIDVVVQPQNVQKAKIVMSSPEGKTYNVDFAHEELENLNERGIDDLFAHSQLVKLEDTNVRVMSDEDHLRFLCIHLLRHGAWRPLWLCDIAVAVESRNPDFDWQQCIGRVTHQTDWILFTIRLAHELLGADISHTPAEDKALPRWLLPAVLKQWEKPCSADHAPPELIMTSLRHPTHILKAIGDRWPDPISASIRMNAPFNELPRLPFQIANYIVNLALFVGRLPKLLSRK